jgi:arylformamidase
LQQQAEARRNDGPLVWLDMDQQALDDAYDQTVYAPNREMTYQKAIFNSERVRSRLGPPRCFSYGPTAVETLDVFSPKAANAPVHIYIHGGAWRQRKASEYAYMAELFVRAGAHCVIPDFIGVEGCNGDLMTIADQVTRAVAWASATRAAPLAARPSKRWAPAMLSATPPIKGRRTNSIACPEDERREPCRSRTFICASVSFRT